MLVLVMHHIVSDAWSVGVLVRDLSAFYSAYVRGEKAQLPEPTMIQYADFAHWQRQWLQGAELERQLSYWKAQLHGSRSGRAANRLLRGRVPQRCLAPYCTRPLPPELTRELRDLWSARRRHAVYGRPRRA